MKKITRFLSLIAVLGIALSLSGCSYLDELRASRASVTPDNTIQFSDGTEYIALPECDELYVDFSDGTAIYVVEDEEVPLLLITSYGEEGKKDVTGQFIRTYATGSGYAYHCRADQYDTLIARIAEGFTPEKYGYSYYDYSNSKNTLYILTPQQVDALEHVLDTQEPYMLSPSVRLNYNYRVTLFQYSDDCLFRREAVDLCCAIDRYYLVKDNTKIYDVPLDLSMVFSKILEAKIEPSADF